MPHGQRAAGFKERVIEDFIAGRFTGDDFQFTVAAVKIIILYSRVGVRPRKMTRTDPQGLAAV